MAPEWKDWTVRERLRIVAAARNRVALDTASYTAAISPALSRNPADTLAAEVLPLLAAMHFLERDAAKLLKPRRLSGMGCRFGWRVLAVKWLVCRLHGADHWAVELSFAAARCADDTGAGCGQRCCLKPGRGGRAVADLFAAALYASGLPHGLLRVTDESVEAVEAEIAGGVDKVFFTGSAAVGRILLQRLAQTLTPSVMELSGCDAVVVLPSADVAYVAKAIAFGMRLNGSATCMAPRRILLVGAAKTRRDELIRLLLEAFTSIDGIAVPDAVAKQLAALVADAKQSGAVLHGDADAALLKPLLIVDGTPTMAIAQADLFAPVVTLIDVADEAGVLAAQDACPFGLTASVFGDEQAARLLAEKLVVGTVLINDMIVATADPRLPFGGRRQSGFGATQGAEGLLEMTAAKTIAVRRGRNTLRFGATGDAHATLFRSLVEVLYATGLKQRLSALRELLQAGKNLPR